MAAYKIKWSSLLHLTDLEFIPEAPKQLTISDELIQAISWLTAATKHDRKLLRCDENGALLIADAWSLLDSVETDELYPQSASEDTYTASAAHKGVLVSSSTQIIYVGFLQVSGGTVEWIYVSPNTLYWYPHSVYSIVVHVVPDPNGTASYVGITAYN